MNLKVKDHFHGFTVGRIRPIPGQTGEFVEMTYDKTRTELVWVNNGAANKLFAIGFKTLPSDDTGVFHILEHSVLCGSEKYPVKEPFVELLKSSMNTFLNAMTFPDKTLYPVSSRNSQDYLNLTSVYLDAVFSPRILTNPNIFRQEGWHYEYDGDKLAYNGVVFNEMKGASSSVEGVIEDAVSSLLFPDTSYGCNSGGDPAAIPNLTYEQFLDSYQRHYHPSNARIYLDGDIPLEETLSLLEGYLSRYEAASSSPAFAFQEPRAARKTVYYEAPSKDDLENQAQIVWSKIFGDWKDQTTLFAAEVLSDILTGSNDAPLKKAILDAGLGQNVTLSVIDGVLQPWFTLRVHNMNDANSEKIHALVRETVTDLAEQGIPKESLEASINRFAFHLQNMQEPQALIRGILVMNSWLYDGDPMQNLHFDQMIAQLRAMAASDGFERLLKTLLLEEDTLCELHVLPSLSLGEEIRAKEQARLSETLAGLSPEELSRIQEEEAALKAWQQTPDSPEALATLPLLDLSEISPDPPLIPTTEDTVSGVTVLRHTINTNGIVHLNLYFSLADLSLQDLTRLSLLPRLLGKLATTEHDSLSLQSAVKSLLGELRFDITSYAEKDSVQKCTPYLCVYCSMLKENYAAGTALLAEILTKTILDQPERIRPVVLQAETTAQQIGITNGHAFAGICALSHFSARAAVNEAVNGYSSVRWLHDFAKDFDGQYPDFLSAFTRVMTQSLCRERLTASLTAESPLDLSDFLETLPAGTSAPAKAHYESPLPKRLGIQIPAQVSYAVLAYQASCDSYSYNGTLRLLGNVVSYDYLWNQVRVQGGAYGVGMLPRPSGNLFCYSYRDPSPARSLAVYRAISDFIKELQSAPESLNKYIISTITDTDPLLSPSLEGRVADENYLCHRTREDLVRERKEILSSTKNSLSQWLPLLNEMASQGAVCVVGHEAALASCKDENLTIVQI